MTTKTKAGKVEPAIRAKALDLVAYLQPKDWPGQVNALFEFVRDRIRYVHDINGVETLTDATQTLIQQQGDCDDKAILLAALLESIGHPTRFVALGFKPGDFSHVITQTIIGKRWVSLDPTENVAMGWQPPNIKNFMVQHN